MTTDVDLVAAQTDALDAVADAATTEQLEQVQQQWLGKNAPTRALQASMRDLDDEGRKQAGQQINAYRTAVTEALDTKRAQLHAAETAEKLEAERLDLTVPTRRREPGHQHLLTQTAERIVDWFVALGYEVADGPELESSIYNFDLLNIEEGHPARADMDTIYVDEKSEGERLLLRTHTSPVQTRLMTTRELPLAAIVPGRVYRQDTVDATHSPIFMQIEGIVVDRGITMADLRGTLEGIGRHVFGADRDVRLLPDFFPFVEPGAQATVSRPREDGTTDWLEILGAGMIHPAVLQACGIDPDEYSGFAFGLGVERMAMLRHGVSDIRDFYESDERFLTAF